MQKVKTLRIHLVAILIAYALSAGAQATRVDATRLVKPLSVTAPELAASSVNSSKIRDTTIVAADIKNATITSAKLANSGVSAGSYPSTNSLVAIMSINAQGQVTGVTQVSAADPSITNEGSLSVGSAGGGAAVYSNTNGGDGVVFKTGNSGLSIVHTDATSGNRGILTFTNTGDTSSTNDLTIADTVRTVSAASTHSKYPTALAVYNAISAGSGGPDSTWAKSPSGSYAGKRIDDNIYREGTIGINTTDTTAHLNITRDSGSTRPAIVANYGDASSAGFNFFSLKPFSQTGNGGGLLGNFNFWASNYPGVNAPYSSRANHAWRFGYNTGNGGWRIVSTDADLHISFESMFHNPALDGITRRVWEWHLESQDTVGGIHRVISAQGAHNGKTGDIGLNSDGLYISRYNAPATAWLQANRFSRSWAFRDSMAVFFDKNGIGAGGVYQRNVDNTAYLALMYADGSNRIVNGGTGVTSVFMPAGKLEIAGIGEIYNTTGNALSLGNDSAPSSVTIKGSGPNVLKMKSVTGGGAAWDWGVYSNYLNFTRPDGNAIMQIYDSAPTTLWGNNKIGIGSNLQSRLSIEQISDGGQGGISLINLSGVQSYLQTNASGNFSYIDNAGASKFEVGTDGGGFGGAPISGWRLYSNGAFRADGAITARGTGTSPSLLLNNTTASTGKEWYFTSLNGGNAVIGNPTTADAITINGTTGATTIANTLTVSTATGTATTVTGRTSAGVITDVAIGSGLSLSGGTLSATGGGGTNYQTLRYDGTGMTQRAAANFVSTGTVAMALTDDAGNGETEIRATIPAGAVGDTELAATGVTAATYTNPTLSIDVNGRVTSAANGTPTVVTATSLTADADNLTASAGINVLRVSGDNGIRGITSISATGMPDGQTFRIVNTGTQPLVLQAQHPDATAGNEFLGPKDVFLPGGQSVTAVRDATADGFWVDGAQAQSGQMVTSTVVSGSPTAAHWGSMTFTTGGGAITFGSDGVKHGYWTVNTAASATANPSVSLGKSIAPTRFGQAYLYSRSIVRIPTLSDGSQTFKVFTGFTSTLSLTDSPLSSAGIHYTSTFNSGKWYGYSSDAGAVTTVDLGITVVANTTYVLETYSNLQRTEVRYFVDGVYRGRSTTNMPASGANVYPLCGILKQGGTTTRAVYVTEMSATYLYPN